MIAAVGHEITLYHRLVPPRPGELFESYDWYFACTCGVCSPPRADELDMRVDLAGHVIASGMVNA